LKVCFLLNDLQLSGGVAVVLEHAHQLSEAHDMDVTLALTNPEVGRWDHRRLDGLSFADVEEAARSHFDVAIATWWETAYHLFTLDADRHAYFVQNLEDRFYRPADVERLTASITHDLPVSFITEASWIAETLDELRPDARTFYVRNGVAKDVFVSPSEAEPRLDGPLRVLIEGHPDVWFKGVGDAVRALEQTTEPLSTTFVTPDSKFDEQIPFRCVGPLDQKELAALYAKTDVIVKLSRVEGMFGPPLEAFHMGATCVVTPVTGHEEYVVHGWNGVVADWDDPRGTARWIDLLARDRRRLDFLRSNALATAKAWPSCEQSAQFMAAAISTIRRLPPPKSGGSGSSLMQDLRAGSEDFRRQQAYGNQYEKELVTARAELESVRTELTAAYENEAEKHRQVVHSQAYRVGLRLRRIWQHPLARVLTFPIRMLYRLSRTRR
jgi:hypothetical protein